MYDIKKLSPYSVAIKFYGQRWVKISYDMKNGGLLIKDKKFKWDYSQSGDVNIKKLSYLINTEYPKQKSAFHFFKIIPMAEAWLFGNSDDDSPMIVTGTTASEAPILEYEAFMRAAERHCGIDDGSSISFGREDVYFEPGNRSTLLASFDNARDVAGNLQGRAHGYGIWVNRRLIGSFARVQNCFREKRYITDDRVLEIELSEDNRGNPVGDVIDR
ncbi:MAG: hypothetical protein HRT44_07765 [Bdellovibrionales bacterium]|nr:hypothetical protein [Bdellovibrionales bacterium]NQZ19135.1 hypothetical protein [Bdellovibrionales bacterium]